MQPNPTRALSPIEQEQQLLAAADNLRQRFVQTTLDQTQQAHLNELHFLMSQRFEANAVIAGLTETVKRQRAELDALKAKTAKQSIAAVAAEIANGANSEPTTLTGRKRGSTTPD